MTDSKSTVHETINSFFPTLLGAIYLNGNDNPYIYHTYYMLAVIYMLQLYRACRLVSEWVSEVEQHWISYVCIVLTGLSWFGSKVANMVSVCRVKEQNRCRPLSANLFIDFISFPLESDELLSESTTLYQILYHFLWVPLGLEILFIVKLLGSFYLFL